MRLYLVQHGEALAKEINPDRPLSEAGRSEVARLAQFLLERGIRVAHVLHSGKQRAEQTAQMLSGALAREGAIQSHPSLNPNDPTQAIADAAAEWSEETMIVGHLPFLGKLVARLTTGIETAQVVAFRPGSVVCLERADDGRWMVAWMIRPELLVAG